MKVVVAVLCVLALASAGRKDQNPEHNYQVWESKWNYIHAQMANNQTWKMEWEKNSRAYEKSLKTPLPVIPFNCQPDVGSPATSINTLRPIDVSVVGALGDSISAGFGVGAGSILEVGIQNRGEVFSIGVDRSLEESVMTLTNTLKKFNPGLKGGSTGTGWDTDPNSWLNVAVGGAKAVNMPGQAERLVDRINADIEIDADTEWKLVTLFIGGNDFCQDCRQDPAFEHAENIFEAVDILRDGLTRTMVQVIVMFDVSPLRSMSTGFLCDILHTFFCPCATTDDDIPLLKPIQMQVYNYLKETIEDSDYYERDDFTVVLQPSMTNLVPPIDPDTGRPDTSYFSPDCFHPGRKGHQGFSYVLWNTMMTRVGQKPLDYPEESESERAWRCPTQAEPYIWTNVNSRSAEEYAAHIQAHADSPHRRHHKTPVAGIVGGVVGAIVGVAIIMVIAVVVYQKRKPKNKATTALQMDNPAVDTA